MRPEGEFAELWLYAKELLQGRESGPHGDPRFEELRRVALREWGRTEQRAEPEEE